MVYFEKMLADAAILSSLALNLKMVGIFAMKNVELKSDKKTFPEAISYVLGFCLWKRTFFSFSLVIP